MEEDMLRIPVAQLHSAAYKRSLKSWRKTYTAVKSEEELRVITDTRSQVTKTSLNPVVSMQQVCTSPEAHSTVTLTDMEVQTHEYWAFHRFEEYIKEIALPRGTIDTMRGFVFNVTRSSNSSLLGKYFEMGVETDKLCNTVETFGLFWYSMLSARNATDKYVALATHAKMLNASLSTAGIATVALSQAMEYFCPSEEFEVQAKTLPFFDSCQMFLDKYEQIKQAPIFQKLYKFSMYSMALSIFSPLGLDLNFLNFEKLSDEAIKKQYHMGPDFVHCVLDTLLFLCQRGYQCYQTQSIMPMFHSEAKYQEWYDTAERLMRQSHFLSNPEVHGIDRFTFLADLKTAIEQGQSMRKCVLKKDEKILISRMLSSLELTHDMEVTKRAAQKDRKTPCCFLLFGGSSIGKSTMQIIMRQHYGKRRGLSTASEFCYVRNPTEEYWSAFNSTQWCIVLDDIAFLSPKLGVLDPSLAEMLCIANNVPFVPAQAELSDKGRTPVRAELVIGSTNTEDLNLVSFFSCPLAVQRRFPWIIDMRVRREYQDPDRPGMLDSSRVPTAKVGEYPDLWEFVIKRIEPCGEERNHQMGRTVIHAEYKSMREFLVWYNEVIDKHNEIQDIIMSGNNRMEETQLCDQCQVPTNWCQCMSVQTNEFEDATIEGREQRPTYIDFIPIEAFTPPTVHPLVEYVDSFDWVTRFICWFYMVVYALLSCSWFRIPMDLILGDGWFYRWIWASHHRWRLARVTLGYAGRNVQQRLGNHTRLAAMAGVIAGGLLLYKSIGSLRNFFCETPSTDCKKEFNPTIDPTTKCNPHFQCSDHPVCDVQHTTQEPTLATQGGKLSLDTIGKKPAPDDLPREKPSYVDPFPFSPDDLSQTTLCSKHDDGALLEKHIAAATAMFSSLKDGIVRNTTAVNVRGAVYMVNNHGIPATTPFHLDIICHQQGNMTTSMKNVLVTTSMVHRVPEHDLAFILLRCRPPATDLTQYFCKRGYTGKLDGKYIGRDVRGLIWTLPVTNAVLQTQVWKSHDRHVTQEIWHGHAASPTSVGDCGSILLSHTPKGWAILGIHTLGRDLSVGAMKVSLETVVDGCKVLERDVVSRGRVEISAPSAKRTMTELSVQSVIHRAQPGVANVIGSFQEFRQRGRTNVMETYIAPVLRKYGYAVNRAKPDMTRKPWMLALNDTTRPVVLLDNDIVNTARDMFIQETEMPDYSTVHVYSLDVAINGFPGLEYCDKMNRKSSAGAPYKRPKSKLMYFVDEETSTDMDVVDEIKDTIAEMITTYQRGERVHTVFCGHLKDEPVTLEKSIAGKTRVFTASGMAYTLVVRMHLLAVIVFMQKNRFTFETGPGTVVQSLEWEAIREHLVQHGEDKIVAGDYSKFDKRMPANMILAAFDVIIDICKKAGYTTAELSVVRGIAYDTAFPTVDFNGDLIEFFGSNPSGHPLTVIINGIVNSLYMRYCYLALQPIKGVNFKSNVALMTYGDDNIMGVSSDAPWFNHTAIQKVLQDADIGYTMADKEAVSVPYIHINDANFLKRTWRWDEDIGAYVAPLDRSSIEKMLMICVAKPNIGRPQHAMQVIGTALREYFWYGREEFETSLITFQEVVSKAGLELYDDGTVFPKWDELVADFWARSEHVQINRLK